MSFDYELPDGWSWKTIEEVQESPKGATITGPFGSSIGKKFFVEKGVPVIRGNNLSLGMTPFIDDGFVYVSEEKADELKRYKSIADDLLFTAAGTIGQVGIIPKKSKYDEYIISNKQLRARLDTTVVDPTYAYYWFSSKPMVEYIKRQDTGSTIPLINLGVLRSLPLPVPPLDVQVRIRKILKSFDKKIWINTQTNQTLEAMAQAIFKSWFVDFDPVKAKMNGEQPEGMDEATASLFPDKLAESQVGLIPEGWSVNQLSDICKNHSQSYDLKSVDEVVFVNTGDVLEGDFLHKDYSPVVGLPGQAKKAIKEDDILYSEIRPKNKRFAYVDFDVSDYVVSTKFMVIQANEKVHPRLLYMMLTRQNTIDEFNVIADSRSGTFPQITFKAISNLEFCMAPRKVQDAFVAQVMPMIQLQRSLKTENKRLAELRDTLLPKLLSGEIELGQAQELAEVE
ncbi:restriction endonuclease subunit S [Vibrio alginolyticus]|nr:restriction endonuclease subunit S [Vibrio parahaemolyticus]